MPPCRRWLRLLAFAALLLGGSHALSQGDTDRNCEFKGDAQLPPGSHFGRFESVTGFLDSTKAKIHLVRSFRGTFRLDVDKQGKLTNAVGSLQYSFAGGNILGGHVGVGISETGSAELEAAGRQEVGQFKLTGKLTTSGGGFAKGSIGKGNFDSSGSTTINLEFILPAKECGAYRGTLSSDAISVPNAKLQGLGYAIGFQSQKWEFHDERDRSEELIRFAKRVEEALKVDPHLQQRRIAKQRMDNLMWEIWEKHEGTAVGRCMHKLWLEGAHLMFTRWLDEDLPKLKAYSGDSIGMRDLVKTVLDSDAMLVTLGIDGCSRDLHVKVWTAVKTAFTNVLKRAYATQAVADILALTRNADIIGNISPQLHDDVLETLREVARKHLKDLKAQLDAARKAGYRPTKCNQHLLNLIQQAIFAARQGELLGVEDHGVTAAAGQLMATVSLADIRECSQQKAKQTADDWKKTSPAGGGR